MPSRKLLLLAAIFATALALVCAWSLLANGSVHRGVHADVAASVDAATLERIDRAMHRQFVRGVLQVLGAAVVAVLLWAMLLTRTDRAVVRPS